MTELFDPFFNIQFKCDKDIDDVISTFQSKFESMMIKWQGGMGQNENYYFDFHNDPAYKLGLSPFSYELDVAGIGNWEDIAKQEMLRAFAKSVITHFQEQGCLVDFTTLFPLYDN